MENKQDKIVELREFLRWLPNIKPNKASKQIQLWKVNLNSLLSNNGKKTMQLSSAISISVDDMGDLFFNGWYVTPKGAKLITAIYAEGIFELNEGKIGIPMKVLDYISNSWVIMQNHEKATKKAEAKRIEETLLRRGKRKEETRLRGIYNKKLKEYKVITESEFSYKLLHDVFKFQDEIEVDRYIKAEAKEDRHLNKEGSGCPRHILEYMGSKFMDRLRSRKGLLKLDGIEVERTILTNNETEFRWVSKCSHRELRIIG